MEASYYHMFPYKYHEWMQENIEMLKDEYLDLYPCLDLQNDLKEIVNLDDFKDYCKERYENFCDAYHAQWEIVQDHQSEIMSGLMDR